MYSPPLLIAMATVALIDKCDVCIGAMYKYYVTLWVASEVVGGLGT